MRSALFHGFESHYRGDEQGDEEQSPKSGGFAKNKNANYDCSHGSYACPNGVCCADGQCLCGFGQ